MKRFGALLALFFLTSCIDVGDFGSYADKMVLDPAVIGTWSTVATRDDTDVPPQLKFVDKDGAYEAWTKKDVTADNPVYPVKSLALGPYRFFAGHDPKTGRGFLIRYEVTADTLTIYTLSDKSMAAFLKKKKPQANIKVTDTQLYKNTEIKRLDDASAALLAAVPNTPDYWHVAMLCRRDVK